MSVHAPFRTAGDRTLTPALDDAALAAEFRAPARRLPDEGETGFGADLRDSPAITEILRGSDLDVLLHGVTGSDYLYGGWAAELPAARADGDVSRFIERPVSIDGQTDTPLVLPEYPEQPAPTKAAGVAQVLPGIMDDDFLLPKDSGLPQVLPDEVGETLGVLEADRDGTGLFFSGYEPGFDSGGAYGGRIDDTHWLRDDDWLF